MSALSVLSSIVPTATGGTAPAPAGAMASDGLFAGMVAAAAPSAPVSNNDGKTPPDLPAADLDAPETPVVDAAVVAAPAWPPIPLIAPAQPVSPDSDMTEPSIAAASPPPAASLPNSAAPVMPPAAEASPAPVDVPSHPATPLAPAAQFAAQAPEPILTAQTTAPAQGEAAQPDAAQKAEPSTVQASTEQATARPSVDLAPDRPAMAEAAARPTPPVAANVGALLGTPQPAASSTPPATPASDGGVAPLPASASPEAKPVSAAEKTRPEASVQARPAPTASPQITATTTFAAAPTVAADSQPQVPIQAEPLKALTEATPEAPRVEVAPPPAQGARSIIAPTPRSQTIASAQPLAVLPAEVADVPEQAASAHATASDAEGEAAPSNGQLAPPAAPTPTSASAAPVAPPRNGAARLDDRPSNAASPTGQTDTQADAKGGAPSPQAAGVQTPTLSAPSLSNATAAKPIASVEAAPLDPAAAPDLAPSQQVLEAQNAAPATARDLGLSQLSRATVETTAQIAAQIMKKLEGRSTRFDMALTPEGLGRVDVSMEIDSEGHLTARLAFDNPAAATDLRSRADELRRQLQDAGFQLTQDSLEFSERNPSSGFGGGAFDRSPDRRAFAGAARVAAEADTVLPPPGAWASLSMTPDRVDMKV
ncbi:flagellar hook-length control protein FliK [Brevundimonas sp. NPDC058933]|uniref:flagellar hook-length control protein FliK n=1 Tax=Brevundimonas sp. NPDC058933 TaxID=3346673 RepID=UPI003BEF4A26